MEDVSLNIDSSTTECSHTNFPEKIRTWCQLVESHSERTGLEPNLIAAVILVESGGKAEVISPSGAVGLMQVMPSDGIAASFMCINGPCFANRPTIEELKDPAFNVEYGTNMLSGLINQYGLRDGLAKYGPGDVGYWYADKVIGVYQDIQDN